MPNEKFAGASELSAPVAELVRTDAYLRMPYRERQTTNLAIDSRIHEKGDQLGPRFQRLVAPRRCALVFADYRPLANYGHPCGYLLYDPDTGKFLRELPAEFPPYVFHSTLTWYHRPVRLEVNPAEIFVPPQLQMPHHKRPKPPPPLHRCALLFSGVTHYRHLNDLEYVYRMLIHRFGFNPGDIRVLTFSGALAVVPEDTVPIPMTYPGDEFDSSTQYSLVINGPGTRPALKAALADLAAADVLFVHTNGEGSQDLGTGAAGLPLYDPKNTDSLLTSKDFAAAVSVCANLKSLIVLMEQCHSGGFIQDLQGLKTAQMAMAIACACLPGGWSWPWSPNHCFDAFTHDWVAAQTDVLTYLDYDPDLDKDGHISAAEAFLYASSAQVLAISDPAPPNQDSPVPYFAGGGEALTLE